MMFFAALINSGDDGTARLPPISAVHGAEMATPVAL